jgi:glycosyltransferase involved in cell wall biosynthesis
VEVITRLRALDRWALPLGALGLAAVAWHNWRLWQRDKATLSERTQPASLPNLETWPALPKVSVLVAAWNEAAHIAGHIRSFLALSYPHKELILCAGGADGTFDLAHRFAGSDIIVLEQQPGEGKQCALRRCLEQASGAVIYLTDADCDLSTNAFGQLIAPLATGVAQVVTGTSEPKLSQRDNPLVAYQWLIDIDWSSRMPEKVDGVLGRNCALLRSTLDQIGGFDAPVATGTDYYMSRRLVEQRFDIWAVPNSRVATDYPASPASYLRMWRRWNKNLLIHGAHFGAWNDIRGVAVAFALYSLTLLLPALALLLGPLPGVLALLLFGYAGTNRLRKLAIGSHLVGQPITLRLMGRVPLYTLLDMLAVILAVRDAASTGRRASW